MKIQHLLSIAFLVGSPLLYATPTPSPILQSNMVLQRNAPIPVWGTAAPKAEVMVEWQGLTVSTHADEQGQWSVQLPACEASAKGSDMLISDQDGSLTLSNILIGDLWFASGQSNMEWPMSRYKDTANLTEGFTNEQIRLLQISPTAGLDGEPITIDEYNKLKKEGQFSISWYPFTPDNTQQFSAVASCFAKNIQEELNIPIGIICNAVGGSSMIHWLPKKLIDTNPRFEAMRGNKWLNAEKYGAWCKNLPKQRMQLILADEQLSQEPLEHPFTPAFLYEKTTAPLFPLPIKGVIWYQGETNAEKPFTIEDNLWRLRQLIKTWREGFKNDQLPFYMVQLPRFGSDDNWAAFREVQQQVTDETEKVELICTLELGEKGNIHPSPKLPLARRLADCVLSNSYGIAKPSSARITSCEWNREGALLQCSQKLTCTGDAPTGFEVSLDGGKSFTPVSAKIEGQNIQLFIPERGERTGEIRYNYQSYMEPNIVTKGTDLPLFPWRNK